MILDYERYQIKSKRRKKRKIILAFLFIISLLIAFYFFLSDVIFHRPLLEIFTNKVPKKNLAELWSEYYKITTDQSVSRNTETELKLLNEIEETASKLIENDPFDLQALYYRGCTYYYKSFYTDKFEEQLNEYNLALIDLRRLKLISPNYLEAQLNFLLGRIYFQKKEYFYDLAEKYLEIALNLGYKNNEIYECLFLIFENWAESEKALKVLEKAETLVEDSLHNFFKAKVLAKLGRLAEAKEKLNQILSKKDNPALSREASLLLGEIAFREEDLITAEKIYKNILEKEPTLAEAHFRLALVLEKKGDYAGYRFELRRTLENDPGHSGARSRLK